MIVNILGSGAVGMLLAHQLSKKGIEVQLVRTSITDFSKKPVEITVEGQNSSIETSIIDMVSLNYLSSLEGIVVITTKSYANEKLSKKLSKINSKIPVIIMQNGLNVEKPYISQGFENVLRCVPYITSQVQSDFKIKYRSVKPSPIGMIIGHYPMDSIIETLTTPEFEFEHSDKIVTLVWEKVILNSIFNSLCPLLDVDNGIFVRDEDVYTLASEITHEIAQVAKTEDVIIDEQFILDQVKFISNASTGQLISTLQDLQNGRETEINSLNIAVSELAKDYNLEVPKTKILGDLIKLKSKIHSG